MEERNTLSVADVSRMLDVSGRTLNRYKHRKILVPCGYRNGFPRYDPEDVARFKLKHDRSGSQPANEQRLEDIRQLQIIWAVVVLVVLIFDLSNYFSTEKLNTQAPVTEVFFVTVFLLIFVFLILGAIRPANASTNVLRHLGRVASYGWLFSLCMVALYFLIKTNFTASGIRGIAIAGLFVTGLGYYTTSVCKQWMNEETREI